MLYNDITNVERTNYRVKPQTPIGIMMADISIYYLYPSTLYVSASPVIINTVLGSCVAVCFYDPVLKIGGMNHFMLPVWSGSGLASPKFGNIAIEKLLEKMQSSGSLKYNLKAKIFGGSDILSTYRSLFNIGERNIELAREMLLEFNVPIISSSVGGKLGRKIKFNTHTGEVSLSYISNNNPKS